MSVFSNLIAFAIWASDFDICRHFLSPEFFMPNITSFNTFVTLPLFDAHDQAFQFFGGMTNRGIYDNMKTAVDKVFTNKSERKYNPKFLCLMSHYAVDGNAYNPAAGWEKGQVENQVDNVRDWIFKPRVQCKSLEELNTHLRKECMRICRTRQHPDFKDKTIEEVFSEETPHLRKVERPFNGYREEFRQVSKTCLIHYDNNRYSVDCSYANRRVAVRIYHNRIVAIADNKEIGSHERSFERNRTLYNPYHYLRLLAKKPGALRNGAPFKNWELPEAIKKVDALLKNKPNGSHEMVEILASILDYGCETVEIACDLAIQDGVVNANTILNAMTRLSCKEPAQPVSIDEVIKLEHAPTDDCQRYDKLLKEVSNG